MKNEFNNLDPAGQSLDELLAKAHWSDLDPEANTRLTQRILSTRSPLNSRRAVKFFVAMAACLLLATGVAYLLVHRVVAPDENHFTTVAATPASPLSASERKGDAGVAATARVALPGRAPNPYELWYVSQPPDHPIAVIKSAPVVEVKQTQLSKLYQAADSRALVFAFTRETDERSRAMIFQFLLLHPDGMDRALDLILNSSTREKTLAALDALPQPPTNLLLAKLDSPSMARRFAAAKALGSLCHGQTLPTLKQMIARDDHRREALAVLGQCKDSAAAAYIQELQRQPGIASELVLVRDEMKQLF